MKMGKVLIGLLLMLITKMTFSQDTEGCKEHPMFPNRMSNYLISECTNNFNATEFWISPDASKTVTKEGTTTSIRYDFNAESGQQKPSALQILRNYENAAKKIGGITMYFNTGSATGVFKIIKNGKELAWVKVESGGNDHAVLDHDRAHRHLAQLPCVVRLCERQLHEIPVRHR